MFSSDGKLSNDEFLTIMKNWKLRASKVCYQTITIVLPQIMAWAFISFQQVFTPASKRDQQLYNTGIY